MARVRRRIGLLLIATLLVETTNLCLPSGRRLLTPRVDEQTTDGPIAIAVCNCGCHTAPSGSAVGLKEPAVLSAGAELRIDAVRAASPPTEVSGHLPQGFDLSDDPPPRLLA